MLPTPYGGITRRPPLVNVGSLSSVTVDSVVYYPSDARAFDFIYSSTYRYIVIFVVYTDPDGVEDDFTRIVVQDTSGTQKAALSVPYTQQEVLELDTHHSNDTMWIAHQNHFPAELKRVADDDWTHGGSEIEAGPFLDENEAGQTKLGSSAAQWNATIQILKDDKVLPDSVVQDDVTWIGGVRAAEEDSTYSSELSGKSFEKDWKGQYIHNDRGRTWFRKKVTDYPHLLVRVNSATIPSEITAGAVVKLDVTLTEDGNDTTFETSGTVVDQYDAGSVYYILIDNGASFGLEYYYTLGGYEEIIFLGTSNLPDVELPSGAGANYNGDTLVTYDFATFKYSQLPAAAQRAHFLVFGRTNNGGAEITGTQNISVGNSSNHYQALLPSVGKKPYASTAVTNDAGDALFTTTAHGLDVGDTIEVTGTTNHNGTKTVSAVVDSDTFKVGDSYVSDQSGAWYNATYWAEISGLNFSNSNLVELISYGFGAFESDDVGRLIRLRYGEGTTENGAFIESATADETSSTKPNAISDEYRGVGIIEISTDGNYTGELVAEIKKDGSDVWVEVASLVAANTGQDTAAAFNVDDLKTSLRLRMRDISGGSCKWVLKIPDGNFNILKIEQYQSSNTVIARNIYGTLGFDQTSRYSFGAWGGVNGYPAAVTIHENRLWFSGSIGEPFKHWGSVVNKYWNFLIGTFATSAIIFQARADASTKIAWTEVKENDIFFGTDFGEYSAANIQPSETLSAENPPKTRRHTAFGSARIPAALIGNDLAYISADKKKCRLLTYDAAVSDGYVSLDATHKVPDIAGSGFIGHVLQRTPYPVLWLWTSDGTAVSLTLDKQHNVIGWAEHSTNDGLIKSLCVIPDENGIDEVYAVVERDGQALGANSGVTTSPEIDGILYSVNYAYVFGGGDSDFNGKYAFFKTISDQPEWRQVDFGTNPFRRIIYIGTWEIEWRQDDFVLGGDLRYTNPSTSTTLPDSGWVTAYPPYGDPPPTEVHNAIYEIGDGSYYIRAGGIGYELIDASDGTAYFESTTIEGTYTPVAGSGATGDVDVGALNYHIEKLDYSEAEYTDNLNGPSEEIITSIMEPTPLFLEGNMKFRSSRGFIYVNKSNGGEISLDGGTTWNALDYSDLTADANGLYTGMIEFKANSGYVDYSTIQVRTTGTDALTVTGLALEVEEHNRNKRGT
jgi:hypothetical protein